MCRVNLSRGSAQYAENGQAALGIGCYTSSGRGFCFVFPEWRLTEHKTAVGPYNSDTRGEKVMDHYWDWEGEHAASKDRTS